MGEGWWIASDGKWYPGSTHPDARARGLASGDGDSTPTDGWWQASDGNWYAPELHPDNIAAITLSRRASPRAPAGIGGSQAGPPGYARSHEGGSALDSVGPLLAGTGTALATNGTAPRMNGSRSATSLMPGPASPAPPRGRRDIPSGEQDCGLTYAGDKGPSSLERRHGPVDRRAPLPDRRDRTGTSRDAPERQRQPVTTRGVQQTRGDLDLEPALLLGEWVPPAPSPLPIRPQIRTPSRPQAPSYRKAPAAPRGQHPDPRSNGARHPSAPLPGRAPGQDGFEEWLRTCSLDQPQRSTRPAPSSQRLMGVADVLNGARLPAGGPTSIVPRVSSREADFFVIKPARKKDRATRSPASSKLSGALFVLAIVVVLAAVGIAVVYIHSHPH